MNIPLDTDYKDKLRLSRNVVGAFLLSNARKADLLPLCVAVFLYIFLGPLEDDGSFLLVILLRVSGQFSS